MHTSEKETFCAILIAIATVAIIILGFVGSVIRQHRKYRLLYKEKIRAEITTLENERKRLSGDLHDELGPTLSGIKLILLGLHNLSTTDYKAINNVLRQIDKMVDQLRTISYGLMPPALEMKGLVYAVETYINAVKTSPGLVIHFHHNNIELRPFEGLHVYRILLEIIHNTIKHAAATQLHIELRLVKYKLIITTADDGIGFDSNAVIKNSSGLGLPNLQSRVDILHGTVCLISSHSKGTSYTIEIPLADTKN